MCVFFLKLSCYFSFNTIGDVGDGWSGEQDNQTWLSNDLGERIARGKVSEGFIFHPRPLSAK